MQTQLHSPFGTYQLKRFPVRAKEILRAWDAADELILDQVHTEGLPDNSTVLVFNDAYGALSLPLSKLSTTVISDSFISHSGIRENLKINQLSPDCLQLQDCLSAIKPTGKKIDLILLKVPKNHSLLEFQLDLIQQIATPSTRIIAGGMAKYVNKSMLATFEKIVGPTKTSLAKKKARLIFSQYEPKTRPHYQALSYQEGQYKLTLLNHANVFSRQKQDIGARFFIEHFPKKYQCQRIIDLGCGNGVLGFTAAKLYPKANIVFCDESYFALQSAKDGAQANFTVEHIDKHFSFHVDDILTNYQGSKADLILCNPPFHQQHTISDHIAWGMFQQAAANLTTDGHLYVIGNRHLGYHSKLKRIFDEVKQIASDRKFVLLSASKCRHHH